MDGYLKTDGSVEPEKFLDYLSTQNDALELTWATDRVARSLVELYCQKLAREILESWAELKYFLSARRRRGCVCLLRLAGVVHVKWQRRRLAAIGCTCPPREPDRRGLRRPGAKRRPSAPAEPRHRPPTGGS